MSPGETSNAVIEPATRPELHLTAPAGWVNDPLGLTWHEGRYHLFYQHVPGASQWEPTCHWGHAVSDDLLSWQHLPVALSPGDGDGGAWSGCLVAAPKQPARIFYTAVDLERFHIGRVRVATARDEGWVAWEKGDVVVRPPDGPDVVAWRDPQIVHDGTCWWMIIGSGLPDGTALAYTYRSDDLEHWTFQGELTRRHTSETDGTWTGTVWECPQLIRVGDEWALVVAVWEPGIPYYEAYAVGSLEEGRFTARSWHRLTYGGSYYAGSVYHDRDGAPGMVMWLRGVAAPDSSWTGAISLPHTWVRDGDRIRTAPHHAVDDRRGQAQDVFPGVSQAIRGPVDIEWSSSAGEELLLLLNDGTHANLEATSTELVLATSIETVAMPRDETTRVIVDAGVIEVFSSGCALAAALPATVAEVSLRGTSRATCHQLA